MELRYTPRTINELEVEKHKPITEIVSEFSMRNLTLLVKKGLGTKDEKEAEEAIEKFFDDGGDMPHLYLFIVERLQANGFLPRTLNTQELREKMEKPVNLDDIKPTSV